MNAVIQESQYLGVQNIQGTPYVLFLVIYLPDANGIVQNAPSQFYNSNYYRGFFTGDLPGFKQVYPNYTAGTNFVNFTDPVRIYEVVNYTGGTSGGPAEALMDNQQRRNAVNFMTTKINPAPSKKATTPSIHGAANGDRGKAERIALAHGTKFSTNKGSEFSGKAFNDGLQFFLPTSGSAFGVQLIFLTEEREKGRRLLTISEPFGQSPLRYADESVQIIVGDKGEIGDASTFVKGRWMKSLAEFDERYAEGATLLRVVDEE